MKTIDVNGGRVRVRYGIDSPSALVDARSPLFASPLLLRELARAFIMAADDIESASGPVHEATTTEVNTCPES